jgi:hypothetical protein
MALAGSTPVTAGATSVTVAVSPPITTYTPLVAVSWNSTTFVVGTPLPASFTIGFGTPAPAGGGTLFWQIQGGANPNVPEGQLATLAGYLDDLRRLLHDPTDQYWSAVDKTAYINKAIQRRDLETGANRQLIPFTLSANVDTYSFSNLGQAQVFDVVGINLIYVAQRIVLDRLSFTRLNAWIRQWSGQIGPPSAFCRYGPNQVIFGPVPSLGYETEWDCSIYAVPLVNLTDTDPLPYPYTNAVPYYAAFWAKLNERQYDEAEGFKRQYDEQINAAVNSRVAQTPSAYGGVVRMG